MRSEVNNYVASELRKEDTSPRKDTKDSKDEDESGSCAQPEVDNCSEREVNNYSKPHSVTEKSETPCGLEDINNDTSKPTVTINNELKSELEVKNTVASAESRHEQIKNSNNGVKIDRLGVLARILVGLCEDFPVVLAVYYPTVMPMCGVPAKQNARSGVILATIISSMLNSLWTMICLFCELSGCPQTGVCCLVTPKNKTASDINGEGKRVQNTSGEQLTKSSKLCFKRGVLTGGKVIVGGSLELPMWLTDGFLVTFFGRWWGAVRIHVSHVQLPYTVHCTR